MPLGMEVGLGPGDFVLDGDPALFPKKGAEPPNFRPMFIVPNGWMDLDGTWHGGRPQPRRPCGVRWGPSPLPKKGAEPPPQFSAHFYCGQTAGCTKMPLGMELGINPWDFVLDGTQPPPQKWDAAPALKFSAHVYCRQAAG